MYDYFQTASAAGISNILREKRDPVLRKYISLYYFITLPISRTQERENSVSSPRNSDANVGR